MSKNRNAFDYIYKAGEILAAIFFISLCLSVSVQVVSRYFFNHNFGWAEEFPIFIFLWVSFVSAAVAYRDGGHLSVDFIADKLPSKIQPLITYINLILSLFFVLLVSYFELKMSWGIRTSTFVIMKISKTLCYIGIPLSCLLFASFIFERILQHAGLLVKPEAKVDELADYQ